MTSTSGTLSSSRASAMPRQITLSGDEANRRAHRDDLQIQTDVIGDYELTLDRGNYSPLDLRKHTIHHEQVDFLLYAETCHDCPGILPPLRRMNETPAFSICSPRSSFFFPIEVSSNSFGNGVTALG